MATVTPRTLSGFMELLPAQQQQLERMMDILRTTYSRYGFTPLDTPVIEASEVLLAKGGGETEKQIYRFQKGDSDLALRFDLTVPLAKYVALHESELTFPFRRYQIGKVYRGERAQRGRFREFYQADIDVIGDGKLDITNEAEVPAIIYQVFSQLGLRRFQIRVNNRKILNGFYAMLGLGTQAGDIMRTVDKLDKIGAEKVRVCLIDDCGVAAEQAMRMPAFFALAAFCGVITLNQTIYQFLPSYALSFADTLPQVAAASGVVASAAMAGQAVGKIILGAVNDKSVKAGIALGIGSGVVGVTLMWLAPGALALLLAGAFLFGVVYAMTTVQTPLLVRTVFGSADYTNIYSRVSMVGSLMSAVAAVFWGFVCDSAGGYALMFILGYACMAFCAAAALFSLKKR